MSIVLPSEAGAATAPAALPSLCNAVELGPAIPAARQSHTEAQGGATPSSPRVAVPLGPLMYALAWLGLQSLHAVCAVYFILTGMIYGSLQGTRVNNVLEIYQLTLGWSYYQSLAAAHYVGASIHLYCLLGPLRTQLLRRLLAQSRVESARSKLSSFRTKSKIVSRSRLRANPAWLKLVRAYGSLFNIQGENFEALFLVREVVETLLQTYQAYTMSRVLTRRTLNEFYTLMLVINCWSTPILKRVCGTNRQLARLLVVLCDMLLDFISSLGVPVVIAFEYFAYYDSASTDFLPLTIWWDDVWVLNFMNEAPLVLMNSWLDVTSRLVFSVGLLLAMNDVKSLISLRPSHGRSRPRTSTAASPPLPPRTIVCNPIAAPQKLPRQHPSSGSSTGTTSDRHTKVSKWAQRVLLLWGLGIGGLYLESVFRATPHNCPLVLRPWFLRHPACALVQFECTTASQLTGSAADFEQTLGGLDSGSVQNIVYRHCPQIELPVRFTTLHNLRGISMYNSTVHQWGTEAAVTQASHPFVRFVIFIRTDFPNAVVPLGLLDPDFPPSLSDVEFIVSKIQRLPPSVPWPVGMLVYIEFCEFDAFPEALIAVRPIMLSLAFNRIPSVPAEFFMAPGVLVLILRGNPIRELPETGVDAAQLRAASRDNFLSLLGLERTLISRLPEWMTAEFVSQVTIQAAQSPFCAQILQNHSSSEREVMLLARPWLARVEAHCEVDIGLVGLYPITEEDRAVWVPN